MVQDGPRAVVLHQLLETGVSRLQDQEASVDEGPAHLLRRCSLTREQDEWFPSSRHRNSLGGGRFRLYAQERWIDKAVDGGFLW